MGLPKSRNPAGAGPGSGGQPKESCTRNHTTQRRLPPFANAIIDGRRKGHRWAGTSADGRNHTAWILVGSEAWGLGKRWNAGGRLVTLCPDDPDQYRFDCLAGLDPVLLRRCGDADGELVERLILRLLQDGVQRVLEIPSLIMHTGRAADE